MSANHMHTPVIEAMRPFLNPESIHRCPLCQKEFCGSMSILFEATPQGLREAMLLLQEIACGVVQAQPPTIVESQPGARPRTMIVVTDATIATDQGTLPITNGFITVDGQEIPLLSLGQMNTSSQPAVEQIEQEQERADQTGEPLRMYPSWNILKDLHSRQPPRTIGTEEQAEDEAQSQDD